MTFQQQHKQALSIRAFETNLLTMFSKNQVHGTVHTYIGQEYIAAALCPYLDIEQDAVFAGHRGHGYYLACGGSMEALAAELMCREGALCLGRGGTQHLHYKQFFSNGIQGGISSLGVGFAWALKLRKQNGMVVVQLGDGTLGEGALYEAFNFAALLQVPILFVLEWNNCAQSTDTATTTAGDIRKRVEGFGLIYEETDDLEPEQLHARFKTITARTRTGCPTLVTVRTRRLAAHSKGDDHRPESLLADLRAQDPLNRLIEESPWARAYFTEESAGIEAMTAAIQQRKPIGTPPNKAQAYPPVNSALTDGCLLYTGSPQDSAQRIGKQLNRALHHIMAQDEQVIMLGEDLADPYGGAFKVTAGLSSRYPRRVFSTPISESALTGTANGLALAGLRPVAEIMFGDFVTLAADQLINHAAKFFYMYGGKVTCGITLRMVSGGYRGYGPTHSQSLEGLFCGVPGLKVIALSCRHDVGRLMQRAIYDDAPVVVVENKLLYGRVAETGTLLDMEYVPADGNGLYPVLYFRNRTPWDVDFTIVTYGGMTDIVEQAMAHLVTRQEYYFDYIVLTQLWPPDITEILQSVTISGKLLIVEEGPAGSGIGASIIAAVTESLYKKGGRKGGSKLNARALGAIPLPIPAGRNLENDILPAVEDITTALLEMA